MTIIEAIILGLVQGLTEFLPISSSGHLVLGREILHVSQSMNDQLGITFEVFVHFGTLLAVVTAFWKDVVQLFKAFISLFTIPFTEHTLENEYHTNYDFRTMALIIAGSIPAGLIGIFLDDTIENAFGNPQFVCIMLFVTGGILIASKFFLDGQKKLNSSNALVIGFAQAMAIIRAFRVRDRQLPWAWPWVSIGKNQRGFHFCWLFP